MKYIAERRARCWAVEGWVVKPWNSGEVYRVFTVTARTAEEANAAARQVTAEWRTAMEGLR